MIAQVPGSLHPPGRPEEAHDSWLQPGQILALAGIWGVKQQVGDGSSSPSSLSLSLSADLREWGAPSLKENFCTLERARQI